MYVDVFINIYDLNSVQRREVPGNPPQLALFFWRYFYQSFSFPLRKKETWVIGTVSRVSRSVPNKDIASFYDSVISFRRFVIPWFTGCHEPGLSVRISLGHILWDGILLDIFVGGGY